MPIIPAIGMLATLGTGSALVGAAALGVGAAAMSNKNKSPAAQTTNPETVPGAVPPSSPNSAEVTAAQQDFLRQEMLKKSIRKTIFAGETGGYKPRQGNAGQPGSPSAAPVAGAKGF